MQQHGTENILETYQNYNTKGPLFLRVEVEMYRATKTTKNRLWLKQEDDLHRTGSVTYGLSISGGTAIIPCI